jgi:glycosyltransferase involved in cell wall biosynthesis
MKILFPIGSFYPSQSGGPNNSVFWITKTLKDNNIASTVITTADGLDNSHEIKLNSFLNTDYGEVIYCKTKFHYLPFKAIYLAIKKVFKTDIVHLSNIFYPLCWVTGIFTILFTKKPIIWSARGELDPKALKYSRYKKIPVLWLIKMLPSHRIIFHVTSSQEDQYLKKIFKTANSILIPNLMIFPLILNLQTQNYLLYIGRIHPKKAIENLIISCSKNQSFINSNFKLIIVGNYNNEYGRKLIRLTKEKKLYDSKIQFLGHVEGIKKQKIYNQAYFTFLPSHTENFGNVVLESLAQGTPVVASKGTPWTILEEYEAGFWVNNDTNSLSTVLDKILNMRKEEYLKYRSNSYSLAKDKFDIEKNIAMWIELYSSVLNKTK